jgi:hypothetical protein
MKLKRWPGDAALRVVGDEVARDGETIRTRLMLMDSATNATPWRSGYAMLTDAQVAARQAARQGMIDRATNAWRMDTDNRDRRAAVNQNGSVARPIVHGAVADARAAVNDARSRYVARLQDAWKRPVSFRDGVQPSGHTRPGFDPREPSGVTDPDAAASIERQVEVTRGALASTPRSVSAGSGASVVREAEISVEKRRQAQQAAYSAKLSEA